MTEQYAFHGQLISILSLHLLNAFYFVLHLTVDFSTLD